jgi:hypothetical protein
VTWASTTRGELHILVDIASRDEFVIDSQKAFSSILIKLKLKFCCISSLEHERNIFVIKPLNVL